VVDSRTTSWPFQMRLDGDGGLFNEAEIRVAAFIERSGNANENGGRFPLAWKNRWWR